jgi:hypothetical protein
VVFQIDSLATTCDNEMHETAHRMLSLLLRQVRMYGASHSAVLV